jgi:hypothetical protein
MQLSWTVTIRYLNQPPRNKSTRKPVNQRWYYEPVMEKESTKVAVLEPTVEPDHLGTLQKIAQQDVDNITNDESGACYLHGTVFLDDELGWCRISGWGVDCGLPIVYYAPDGDGKSPEDEHHASLASVLSWIKDSPEPPQSTKYKSSRTLRRSTRINRKGMIMRIMACALELRIDEEAEWNETYS